MQPVIELNHVSKRYPMLTGGMRQTLGYLFRVPVADGFLALDDVSFSVAEGEIFGIIGRNGSGKSTILKIVAGVTTPTSGTMITRGKIGPLIEIGAGMHAELTGRENIFLYGSILGMDRRSILRKFDEIVEFSGIRDFLHTPVKFYSTGMFLRLGFAVTIHLDPEILLVDEVFAVGDETFQRRCLEKIIQFKKQGGTVIIISHNLVLMENLCQRMLWIDRGAARHLGDSSTTVGLYQQSVALETGQLTALPGTPAVNRRYDRDKAEVLATWIDAGRSPHIEGGKPEPLAINMRVKFLQAVHDPIFGIAVYDEQDKQVIGTNTLWQGIQTGTFSAGQETVVTFRLGRMLPPGSYTITAAIAAADAATYYDWRDRHCHFSVSGNPGHRAPQTATINTRHPTVHVDKCGSNHA